MIVSTPKVNFNVEVIGDIKNKIPLVFLHGFMGSTKSWIEIAPHFTNPIILIDLPGHGKSHFKKIDNYSFNDWDNDLKLILGQLEIAHIYLCGYSMGGRLAISFACQFPMIVDKLILESSMPGISDLEERNHRVEEDKLDVLKIRNDYLSFIKYWSENKLFTNQKIRNLTGWEAQKKIRTDQNPLQISLSLEFLGVGKMSPKWDVLSELYSTTMLITGNEDSKYCRIATEFLQKIPDCKWVNISNCGHNIHLEQSSQFIESMNSFLYS